MSQAFPLQPGAFRGEGVWFDSKPATGRFTTVFRVVEKDGATLQITRRFFLNDDGGLLYEENSTVIFKAQDAPWFAVTIRHEGKEVSGRGYLFDNLFHYDLQVEEGVNVDNTYLFDGEKVVLIGSSTNKGNPTVWREVLHPVEP